MKKRLLSAFLAVLTFAGCERDPRTHAAKPVQEPVASLERTTEIEFPEETPIIAGGVDAGAVEAAPDPVDFIGVAHEHRGPSNAHLRRVETLREEGDLGGALMEARRAVHDDPEDEEALSVVSKIADRLKNHALVAEAQGRLAELRPEFPEPLILRARALLSAGEYSEAVISATDGIARDPTNPEGYHVTGRAYLASGDLGSAIEMFKAAVQLDPDHGYALNNLGFAFLRANENEAALEVLSRAAELLPHVAYVHNNLGVALERTGNMEDAKLAYARSTSLSPRYVKANVNSARLQRTAMAPSPEGTPTEPIQSDEPTPVR
jgi:Flp pilus assembly protein TadD